MTAPVVSRFRPAPVITAVVLVVLLLWMFGRTVDVFLLLFIAIIISLYLRAVTDILVSRARLPERVGFALAILGTVIGIVGLFWLVVPPVIQQTQQLFHVLPEYVDAWEKGLDRFMARYPATRYFWTPGEHRVLRAVYDQLAGSFEGVVPKVFSAVHVLIDIFAVGVMSIYLALHPGVYREWLIAIFPPVHRDLVRDVLRDLAETLRAYIVGQLFAMFVLAMLTAIGLYFLNVPYWLTFGVFTGAVAIVPFFGTLISTALPAFFVLGGPTGGSQALLVISLGVVIHLVESNVIAPLVMARKVELPPVLTIMAVLVMGRLIGALGLVVAVPTLASIMVIVRRILINRIYEGKGFRRRTRDRTFVLRVPAPEGGVLVPPGPLIDVIKFREHA